MKNSIDELTYLLKSKTKCIWIKTYEELQCVNDIKKIITENFPNSLLKSWSFFEGLREEPLTPAEMKKDPESISPDRLLSLIIKSQAEGTLNKRESNGKLIKEYINKNENFWIFKDFHLCNDAKNIIRGIRDVKEREPKEMIGYNPIIVISPIVNIPLEHEKLFTIVDYETPDREEIQTFLSNFVNSMKKSEKQYEIPSNQDLANCVNLAQGLTLEEIKDYAKRSLIKYNTLSDKIFNQARLDLIKKTGILEFIETTVGIEDMGGNEVFKAWVEDIKDTFSPEAEAFGVIKPKGYLAVGSPGTSKTLGGQIVAHELNLPMLKFNMSSVMHSHVGQSEKNMENALKIVKACSPCVLLIDEVEKTLSGTGSSNQTDGGTLMRVVGQLLEYLGGDDSRDTFVIMTSNNASALPPELTRSGRIDTTWYFGLPTEEERAEIFKIHLGKYNIPFDESLIAYAASTDKTLNFTGAEIKEVVKVAVRKAFKRYKIDGNKEITVEDIDQAVPEIVPVYESSKEKIAVLEEYYKTRARFSNNKPTDSKVSKISIDYSNDIDIDLDV